MVQFHEMDLAVGDVLLIGETTVTVVDIEDGEVTFRIDDGTFHEGNFAIDGIDLGYGTLPR